MKKALVILLAVCLFLSLFGCGSASQRLIPKRMDEVSCIHAAHYSAAPDSPAGAKVCDGETEITDQKTIDAIIRELHAYRPGWPHRPMSGERRIELSFYSANDRLLGQVSLDDEGICASTFCGQGNCVIGGDFDFARWEALF